MVAVIVHSQETKIKFNTRDGWREYAACVRGEGMTPGEAGVRG
jgi:hypothetical protein